MKEIILFEDDECKTIAIEYPDGWQLREYSKDSKSIAGWYCRSAFSIDKSDVKRLAEIQDNNDRD